VNPLHIYPGTGSDNARDRERVGTIPYQKGSANFYAKLTEIHIPLIHALYHDGLSCSEIAARFDVHPETVGYVVRGRTWTHV
jgi:hypothetical protein